MSDALTDLIPSPEAQSTPNLPILQAEKVSRTSVAHDITPEDAFQSAAQEESELSSLSANLEGIKDEKKTAESDEVKKYLESRELEMVKHLEKLAKGAKSETVQNSATQRFLDEIRGKPGSQPPKEEESDIPGSVHVHEW